ncbi:pilus (MSHA type) biogenesis protein MshL [Aliidiomarina quisquiliarum]|uniref:pilus (MSHA type) biogenesis protein MshL n=1 Tax=Aliidiomarina quisquiliarum TaxID=2938947 RepID=UPI00208EC528|nr:pilus (MSHA type) biogenesis protein MshL [Aliidiomarina quisquiliarum]MCO4322482.1 pilus (MSHA type) biogenesis protein MshL [Aliidiomarina quisquiliarum]
MTNNKLIKVGVSVLIAGLLAACVSRSPEQLSADAQEMLRSGTPVATEEERQVPASVRAELRENMGARDASIRSLLEEPRFSVQAKQMPAADFFAQLTDESPYSLVVHPDVRGLISVTLRDVTLQETLDVVQDIYGFDIRKEGRVFRVYPAGLRVETLTLDYLALRRYGISQTQITAGGVVDSNSNNSNNSRSRSSSSFDNNSSGRDNSNNQGLQNNNSALGSGQAGSSISTTSETDFWQGLQEILQGIIGTGEGRHVVVSPQAGLATIRALPAEIRAARDFLKMAQSSLQRQVVLEARIVEVTLSDQYQQGVDWSRITSKIGSGVTEFTFSGADVENGSLGGVLGLSFTNQTFGGMVELLSSQGQVQVLSSPRVTATNNQKAVIKIGEDEYFVTDISTTTVTGTATTSTPNIQLTPFFSGIALDVTPQIGESGQITLHIHPSVTETTEQEKVISLNNERFVLPLARSNIRESDTIIRARDGEVVIIGGLMQTGYSEDVSQVPLLGRVPFLGELFTNRRQLETKKELVIMLRPTIVGADTWDAELERSRDLLRRWYEAD